MDDTLKNRFEFVKRDIANDDWVGISTLSDVHEIACACILNGKKTEGCELLSAFTILHVNRTDKMAMTEFTYVLNRAEKVLT